MPFAPVRLASEPTIEFCSAAGLRSLRICPSVEIDRPAGREVAARRLRALLGAVVVEHRRECFEPRQIGVAILVGVADGARAGSRRIRHRETGAALLEDFRGELRESRSKCDGAICLGGWSEDTIDLGKD